MRTLKSNKLHNTQCISWFQIWISTCTGLKESTCTHTNTEIYNYSYTNLRWKMFLILLQVMNIIKNMQKDEYYLHFLATLQSIHSCPKDQIIHRKIATIQDQIRVQHGMKDQYLCFSEQLSLSTKLWDIAFLGSAGFSELGNNIVGKKRTAQEILQANYS